MVSEGHTDTGLDALSFKAGWGQSSFGGQAWYLLPKTETEAGVGSGFEPFSWARHLLLAPAVTLRGCRRM